ncbi:MAG: EAL domain-containing protein [Thermoanaerobaculia bacterium]|nr:EAL domain-containing protein [Thermoanaerobaculia bacterium]
MNGLLQSSAAFEVGLPGALAGSASVCALVMASLILRRHRHSSFGHRFALVLVLASGWLACFCAMHVVADEMLAEQWMHRGLLFATFLPVGFYSFAEPLIARRSLARSFMIVSIVVALVIAWIGFSTDLIVSGFHEYGWGRFPAGGEALSLFLVFTIVLLAGSGFVLFRRHRAETNSARRADLVSVTRTFAIGGCAALDFLPAFGVPMFPVSWLAITAFGAQAFVRSTARQLFPVNLAMTANLIVDTIADGLIVIDRDGRIQLVNHAVESLFGYTEDELRGETIDRLVEREDIDSSRSDRVRALMHGGVVREIERVFRARNGASIPMSVSMAAFSDVGGARGMVMVLRDIRERRKAEAKIRETTSLLRSTLDSTGDAILVIDNDGRIVSYNQRLVSAWQIPQRVLDQGRGEELIRSILDTLKSPEAFLDAMMRASGLGGDEQSFDVVELKDGRVFERVSIPRLLDGKVVGRVWSFREVTERRLAEAATQASERRYRQLFERNAAGVYRASADGTILDCNDAFARILKLESRARAIGRNFSELFFESEEREAIVETLRDGGSLTGVELCLTRPDGSKVWILENVTMIREGDADVVEGTMVDISTLKLAEEQMEFQAYHDVLTLLPNRRMFTDRLSVALAQNRRAGTVLAVMYLDLDRFKTVNDTLGHTAGDELLLIVSDRLRAAVREEDTVARLGGDEFTILVGGLRELDDAARVAEKILLSFQEPVRLGDRDLVVTGSIGVALFPDDGNDAETLLRNADNALYRAKELGRDNYQLCTPQLKLRTMERLSLETRLRGAAGRGELVLHYQPMLRLDTGEVTGFEALLRWNHPEHGLMPPESFIPLAEESRLIVPIGNWVLHEALLQARSFRRDGSDPLRMSVNLSARQLQRSDLRDVVASALERSGLPASTLELEITESAALENTETSVETLNRLREMGVSIAIDDFGTGYSSLTYLKHMPIDCVKIDRSFIRDLVIDPSDAAIVTAIINIARMLKLRVVAEGVETREQVRFLKERRCYEMQGMLFSHPVPADELRAMLARDTAQNGLDPESLLAM